MPIIELDSMVSAPIERVFDLNRSVELHTASTSRTRERAVAGVTSGLLAMGDEVTWEAVHFGVRQRLTSRIVAFERPDYFRDSMVAGAFRGFDHDHEFSTVDGGTRVRERFDFRSPWGVVGRMADVLFLTRYLRAFLTAKASVIKQVAESDDWARYLIGG
jgi:ligand-binding SRPBCC domain-containing protein